MHWAIRLTLMWHELAKHDTSGLRIDVVHTDEYLVGEGSPAYALRKKRKASIAEEFARVIERAKIAVDKDIVGSLKAELVEIRSKIGNDISY